MYFADACQNTFLILLGASHAVDVCAAQIVHRPESWSFDSILALSHRADGGVSMRVIEQDGSESCMCGNGARAVGCLLDQLGMARRIQLQDGNELVIERTVDGFYSVPMGPTKSRGEYHPRDSRLRLPKFTLYSACGEPHAVVKVPCVKQVDLSSWGQLIVPHANCTIVSRDLEGRILARTYERGVNRETQSCGTGATSAAQMLLDNEGSQDHSPTEKTMLVRMKGGLLRIRVVPGRGSFLEGPAQVSETLPISISSLALTKASQPFVLNPA
ncbi:MAG: hypothetical protein KDA84_20045, partial [Planctomycetaceae bacterium]|nr:hypothetical protein [Planctomycetaceae bacterium]